MATLYQIALNLAPSRLNEHLENAGTRQRGSSLSIMPSIDPFENGIGRRLPLAIPMKERLVVALAHSTADVPDSARLSRSGVN
jgi:hypothetical protein